jgi:hypothetical protein
MDIINREDNKQCFVACPKDVVDRGGCSCSNRTKGRYKMTFTLDPIFIRKEKLRKILDKINGKDI